MFFDSIQHDVRYIDPSKLENGDGLTPSTAYNTFPESADAYPNNVVFIIRRTNNTYATVPLLTLNVNSLVILGMPTSDDKELYNLIPEDAKNAWSSDEASNANILYRVRYDWNDMDYTTIYECRCPSCTYFQLNNVNCYVDSDAADHLYMFKFTASGVNVVINDVFFTSSDDWASTGTEPQQWNSVFPGLLYVAPSAYYYSPKDYISITNCRFDLYRANQPTIKINNSSKNISIRNIVVNATLNAGPNYVFEITNNEKAVDKSNVDFANIRMNYYQYNAEQYLPGFVYLQNIKTLNMYDCMYVPADTQIWTNDYEYLEVSDLIFIQKPSYGSRIKNITIDLPEFSGNFENAMYVEIGTNISTLGQYVLVENINISTASDWNFVKYRPQYSSYTDEVYPNPGTDFHPVGGHLLRIRNDRGGDYPVCENDVILRNLTLNSPIGCSLAACGIMLDMSNNTIYGSIMLARCIGKIGAIQTKRPCHALGDRSGNMIHIASITCSGSNNNNRPAINMAYSACKSHILVDTCNIPLTSKEVATQDISQNNPDSSYICLNNNTSVYGQGNYSIRNIFSFGESSNVTRTEKCAIKLYNTSNFSDSSYPLRIGGYPFRRITKSISAGNNIARFYVALRGYSNPSDIKNHLNIIIRNADESIIPNINGNWKEDYYSPWENIEGTRYVYEFPFYSESAQTISFEYVFSWQYADAETYLDLYPEITTVE